MISPELLAEIRRLYYAEHWKIGTIATELKVHADTVRGAVQGYSVNSTAARPRSNGLTFDFIVVAVLATRLSGQTGHEHRAATQ